MNERYFRYCFSFSFFLDGKKKEVIPAIVEALQDAKEKYPLSLDRFFWDGNRLYYSPGINREGNLGVYETWNDKLLSEHAKSLILASFFKRRIFSRDVSILFENAFLE